MLELLATLFPSDRRPFRGHAAWWAIWWIAFIPLAAFCFWATNRPAPYIPYPLIGNTVEGDPMNPVWWARRAEWRRAGILADHCAFWPAIIFGAILGLRRGKELGRRIAMLEEAAAPVDVLSLKQICFLRSARDPVVLFGGTTVVLLCVSAWSMTYLHTRMWWSLAYETFIEERVGMVLNLALGFMRIGITATILYLLGIGLCLRLVRWWIALGLTVVLVLPPFPLAMIAFALLYVWHGFRWFCRESRGELPWPASPASRTPS